MYRTGSVNRTRTKLSEVGWLETMVIKDRGDANSVKGRVVFCW